MKFLDSKIFRNMLIGGCNQLSFFVNQINDLNVFPVPDGDTGTNMNLTCQSAKEAIINLNKKDLSTLTEKFSRGALLGACGNSGVILSQIFKGIAVKAKGKNKLSIHNFIECIGSAKDYAYKSVSKVVEGTILTWLSDVHKALVLKKGQFKNFSELLNYINQVSTTSIKNTPNLLPILKEAGVVDSGAFGLGTFFQGFGAAFHGEEIKVSQNRVVVNKHQFKEHSEFGYCSEFITILDYKTQQIIKRSEVLNQLDVFGNSTIVIIDQDILKIHTHSLYPGKVMNYLQQYGEFNKIKIENMTSQVKKHQILNKTIETAIIAVSNGAGVDDEFLNLGATSVISGGQTMNPSTKEFIDVINKTNAKNYILLPNNKNIIMAAEAAAEKLKNKNISVIKTTSIWEGINALDYYNKENSFIENISELTKTLETTGTFKITKAIKDTSYNGINIKKNQFITIFEGQIICACANEKKALETIRAKIKKLDVDYAHIFIGKLAKLTNKLNNIFAKDDIEINVVDGQQLIYSYIVGIEK